MEKMTRQEFIDKNKKKPPIYKKFVGVTVSLTTEEREQLRKQAVAQGLTVSDYVRSKLFYEN